MATPTKVSEAHVQRVLAAVDAGQRTAGAEMSEDGLAIARRQLRGGLSGDQAVTDVIELARARFNLDLP